MVFKRYYLNIIIIFNEFDNGYYSIYDLFASSFRVHRMFI